MATKQSGASSETFTESVTRIKATSNHVGSIVRKEKPTKNVIKSGSTSIQEIMTHLMNTSRQWTSNDRLSGTLGVDPQGIFVVIPHKKHCHITLQVSTVHHDQADVVYVEEREWCIKETATATLTEKTQNMSSKSRYKPRFKGAVANIKGTPQQLWSKSEGVLDEDLHHCTWNSKLIDNKQSNTESEGILEHEKAISNHSQHWKRKSDLDGDLYASFVRTFENYHSMQSVLAIQIRIIGPLFVGCRFIHLSFLDRIFGEYQSAQKVFAIQVRIIGPPSVSCSFVHLYFLE